MPWRLCIVLILPWLIQACSRVPFRGDQVASRLPCSMSDGTADPTTSVEDYTCVALAVVELTDDGQLANPKQLENARAAIRSLEGTDGATIVLFAHGWRHTAKSSDTHLRSFRKTLLDLYAKDKRSGPILGIYLGWQGNRFERIRLPLWFHNRSDAVNTIGKSARFARLLRELNAEVDLLRRKGRLNALSIGHSLGGKLLFNALEQQLQKGTPELALDELLIFGDRVILLNPAQDVHDYKRDFVPFNSGFIGNSPRLIVFASETDEVVARTWSIAQKLKGLFHRAQRRRQGEDLALGQDDGSLSHSLCPGSMAESGLCQRYPPGAGTRVYGGLSLTPIAGRKTDGPFVVVGTSGEVIANHGDIFNPTFVRFLVDFISTGRRASADS